MGAICLSGFSVGYGADPTASNPQSGYALAEGDERIWLVGWRFADFQRRDWDDTGHQFTAGWITLRQSIEGVGVCVSRIYPGYSARSRAFHP